MGAGRSSGRARKEARSLDPFEDADVIRYRRTAHVEDAAELLILHLDVAGPEHAGDVRQFLTELPEIRSRRLAFNRGVTIPDAFVVATPLLARDGRMIAAISAAVKKPLCP